MESKREEGRGWGEGRAGEGTGELASALRPHFLCLGSSVHVNIETGAPPTYLETCCVGGRKQNKPNKRSISRPGLPSLLASCSTKHAGEFRNPSWASKTSCSGGTEEGEGHRGGRGQGGEPEKRRLGWVVDEERSLDQGPLKGPCIGRLGDTAVWPLTPDCAPRNSFSSRPL